MENGKDNDMMRYFRNSVCDSEEILLNKGSDSGATNK